MAESKNKEENKITVEKDANDMVIGHGFRGDHGEHGPRHDRHEGLPPHILKEIFDLKEKVGKLEGMMEVLLKKM